MGKRKPDPVDLLREAYVRFGESAVERARAWAAALTNGAIRAAEAADVRAFKPVQLAFIAATSGVNSEDRWPLVHEDLVVRYLTSVGKWDGSSLGEKGWQEVWG